jgi:hypothetical protein
MAKPVPIPSLKKPSGSLPVDAMTAFVAAAQSPNSRPAADPPTLTLAPEVAQVESEASKIAAPPEPAPGPVVADAPNTATARPKAAAKKSGRRLEERRDGTVSRKVTIYLAPDLDKQLSLYALTNDVDRSEVVAEVLGRFLRKNA